MKVEIKNGNLVIEIPMGTPAPSASGKTLLVASTHGKPVVVSVNEYIKR